MNYKYLTYITLAFNCITNPCYSWASNDTSTTSVFVDAGGEIGQALLVQHSNACYAIVPTHVVSNSAFITISGTGINPAFGDALLPTDLGYDLSVMPIEGEISLNCGPLLSTIDRNLKSRLQKQAVSLINIVNPDGSVSRIRSIITDQTFTKLIVKPLSTNEALMKGMSGSYVTSVDNKPLGILLSVDASTGEGSVIRIDRALETINPYFQSIGKPAENLRPATELVATNNLAETVSKWTLHAIDKQHRAHNLLATEESIAPWIAKKNGSKIQLVFNLRNNQSQAISQITFSNKGLEGNKSLARQIEILIDSTGNGHWKSIKAITMPKNGSTITASFSPKLAKKVMLQIYDNWGDRHSIALGRVHISGE